MPVQAGPAAPAHAPADHTPPPLRSPCAPAALHAAAGGAAAERGWGAWLAVAGGAIAVHLPPKAMAALPAPSFSGVSIASDDALFGEMLRVAAGASDCSWQAPRSATKRPRTAEAARGAEPKRAREPAASAGEAAAAAGASLRCLDPTHAAGCSRCVPAGGVSKAKAREQRGVLTRARRATAAPPRPARRRWTSTSSSATRA